MSRYKKVPEVAAEVYLRGGNPDIANEERIADNLEYGMDVYDAARIECEHQTQRRLEQQSGKIKE